ncbi:MAG TPA: 2-oxoacid:acceptor oxidoreductase subunit alpha [Candidatus Hydrogenedentes bacterium]|nr:2-oxoacid:acceptor oxidoreductase subunit alpha [Candidatus Hydrogenedentota bacterium]HOV74941.1 2-oxoacid:acceptor oxidoreductase subunit alpha [Candidatus Hydrogenedentota bacterium]
MPAKKRRFLLGNQACVEGAIYAGVRFYAGYPITPSTEVAEGCARAFPKLGGRFIQMEDEIASIGAVIGASIAGLKSMTATSGPGYSLMVENIGYAYMIEAPCVIVNVQRGGPSTGLPTKVGQADTMQARWGPHGDYTAIAVAPSTVAETFTETVRAVNLSERFRTPVTILLDEVIGHMQEMVSLPEPGEYEIVNRIKPTCDPDEYMAYGPTENLVNPLPAYGDGYRWYATGLTHDPRGFPTNRPDEIVVTLDKLRRKIEDYQDEIEKLRLDWMDDAEVAIVSYGSVSRTTLEAVMQAREAGIKAGCVQLLTIWPFPSKRLREILLNTRNVIVAELNMGQLIHEVERIAPRTVSVHSLLRYDGEIFTPAQIIEKIQEVSS